MGNKFESFKTKGTTKFTLKNKPRGAKIKKLADSNRADNKERDATNKRHREHLDSKEEPIYGHMRSSRIDPPRKLFPSDKDQKAGDADRAAEHKKNPLNNKYIYTPEKHVGHETKRLASIQAKKDAVVDHRNARTKANREAKASKPKLKMEAGSGSAPSGTNTHLPNWGKRKDGSSGSI